MSENRQETTSQDCDEQNTIEFIWCLLDRDKVVTELAPDWPGINEIAVREKLVSPHDPGVGPMPSRFAYFLAKDFPDMALQKRIDREA